MSLQSQQTLILNVNITNSFTRYYADTLTETTGVVTEASCQDMVGSKRSSISLRKSSLLSVKKPANPRGKRSSKFVETNLNDGIRRDVYRNAITKGIGKQQRVSFGDEVGKHFKETVIVPSYKAFNTIERHKEKVNCCAGKCLIF
jgi:hypothetical protein